jgi:hypothetical protein
VSAVIGIDPGATGWIVAVDSDGIVWSSELPTADGGVTAILCERADLFVFVERQQPMPRDKRGVIGGFRSGYGYGRIMEAVVGLHMRHQLVRSQDWQRVMLRGEPKARGRELKETYTRVAERLWPRIAFRGPRGGLLDGKAAAAMIAEYGRRMLMGKGVPK